MNAQTGSSFVEEGAPGTRPESDIAIEARGITKRFPGVVANDRVDLAVRRGDVHAIVGPHYRGIQFHAESILTENGYDLLHAAVRDLLT